MEKTRKKTRMKKRKTKKKKKKNRSRESRKIPNSEYTDKSRAHLREKMIEKANRTNLGSDAIDGVVGSEIDQTLKIRIGANGV
jgi:hypothetical protein